MPLRGYHPWNGFHMGPASLDGQWRVHLLPHLHETYYQVLFNSSLTGGTVLPPGPDPAQCPSLLLSVPETWGVQGFKEAGSAQAVKPLVLTKRSSASSPSFLTLRSSGLEVLLVLLGRKTLRCSSFHSSFLPPQEGGFPAVSLSPALAQPYSSLWARKLVLQVCL